MHRKQQVSGPSSIKNDWLGQAILSAKLAASAGDCVPIPGVGAAAALIVTILELIQKSSQNKKDFKEMTQSLLETIQVLQEAVASSGRSDTSMFKDFCLDFEEYLGSLTQEIQDQANSKNQRGILGIFKANKVRDKVEEYRRRIELLKGNFSLHVSVGTRIAQETTLDAISNLDNGFQTMHSGLSERLANIDTRTRDIQRSIHNQSMLLGSRLGAGEEIQNGRVYARKIYVVMEADIFLQKILSSTSPAPYSVRRRKQIADLETCNIVSCISELESSSKPKLVRVYRGGSRTGRTLAIQKWKEDRDMFLRARHPNLLQLYACCDSYDLAALIFHTDAYIGLASQLLDSVQGLHRLSLISSWESEFTHASDFLRSSDLIPILDSTEALCTPDGRLQLCQLQIWNPNHKTISTSGGNQHVFYGGTWWWHSPWIPPIPALDMPLTPESLLHFYQNLTRKTPYAPQMLARTWRPTRQQSGTAMHYYGNLPPGCLVDDAGDLISFPDSVALGNLAICVSGVDYVELPGHIFRIPISESGVSLQFSISKGLTREMEDQILFSAFTQVDQWFNRDFHWTFQILLESAFQIKIRVPGVLEGSLMQQQLGSDTDDNLDEPLFAFVSLDESLLDGMIVYRPTCYISRDSSGNNRRDGPPKALDIEVSWRRTRNYFGATQPNGFQMEALMDLHARIPEKVSISEYLQMPLPLHHIVMPRGVEPTFPCKGCEAQGTYGHSHPREQYRKFHSNSYHRPVHPQWHSLCCKYVD
ncbi:hypothetical protein C8J56DRAFT_1019250 [Mycena floridula]|nr:hypothetical protein C8J56DRAFT_1019250 [Mycena floridula]